jgi:hypothetical protein
MKKISFKNGDQEKGEAGQQNTSKEKVAFLFAFMFPNNIKKQLLLKNILNRNTSTSLTYIVYIVYIYNKLHN